MGNKLTRVIGIALTGTLFLTAFAGCGSASKASDNKTTQPKDTPQSSKRVELKLEVFDRGNLQAGQDPLDNNWVTKYIQKEFGDKNNIDIKWVPIPRSKEVDQLNILMAAGEAPDLAFTYDNNVVNSYVKNGGLADLTEVLKKNGPNLTKFLGSDILEWGVFDGKQYSIPQRRAIPGTQASVIRKDWLDKVGMKVPTTTDEFYNVMKAFKERDPGNVGKDKIIPFRIDEYGYQILVRSFVPKITEEEMVMYDVGATSNRPNPMTPGYKEGFRFLNKLANEGLLNLDWIMDKNNQKLKEDIVNGRVGSWTANQGLRLELVPDLKKNVPDAQYVVMDPFTNFEGKRLKNSILMNGAYLIVPKASQRAAEVIKYLDWMSDSKVLFYIQNGTEGKNYTMQNGLPMTIVNDETKKDFWTGNNADFTMLVNGKWLGSEEQNVNAQAVSYPGSEQLYKDEMKSLRVDTMPAYRIEKPVDSEGKYGTTLVQKWQEIIVKLLSAKPSDFDKTWDSVIPDYMKAGMTEIANDRKAAWNAQKKK